MLNSKVNDLHSEPQEMVNELEENYPEKEIRTLLITDEWNEEADKVTQHNACPTGIGDGGC